MFTNDHITSEAAGELPGDRLAQLQRACDLFVRLRPGESVELRVLGLGPERRGIAGGFYDSADALARDAALYDGRGQGVYVTLNPTSKPANNSRDFIGAGQAAGDKDITRRAWVLVDCDPERASGTSSTEYEHEQALARARGIAGWLSQQHNYPKPVLADSGNGAHLLYRVDLKNDGEATALIRRFLEALALEFGDDEVKVDVSVATAARICKFYGTLAAKGEASAERPHRRSAILDQPEEVVVVGPDQLAAVAAQVPADEGPTPTRRDSMGPRPDVAGWLSVHAPGYRRCDLDGKTVYKLPACPFSADHTDGAWVCEYASGAVAAGCWHDSCTGKDFQALKDVWASSPYPARGTARDPLEDDLRFTDLGNARRLVELHGEDLRYRRVGKTWFVWDGHRWAEDERGEPMRRAKDTVEAMFAEAFDLERRERDALLDHARRSASRRRLEDMVALAETEARIVVAPRDLDTDDHLVNCLSGTLDLRTGELCNPSRGDLITKLAPVEYRPGGHHPEWDGFLERATGGDAEMLDYLQKLVGQCLAGAAGAREFYILHGPPGTGKTVLLEGVKAALGDYAKTADIATFTAQHRGNAPRGDLVRLAGARVVLASEGERGERMAAALLKKLSGGDTFTGRELYRTEVEFTPKFRVWFATNEVPHISADDDGVWARVKLIPFTHQAEKDDKAFLERVKEDLDIRAAVFAWAVEGNRRAVEEGVDVPGCVQAATEEQREEMNPLAEFLEEQVVKAAGSRIKRGELHERYVYWARAHGQQYPLGSKAFTQLMVKKGYERSDSGERFWKDCAFREGPTPFAQVTEPPDEAAA